MCLRRVHIVQLKIQRHMSAGFHTPRHGGLNHFAVHKLLPNLICVDTRRKGLTFFSRMLSEIGKFLLKLVVVDSVAVFSTIGEATLRRVELALVHDTLEALVTDLIVVDDADGWVRLTFNDVSAILEHAHRLLPSRRVTAQLRPVRLKAHTV